MQVSVRNVLKKLLGTAPASAGDKKFLCPVCNNNVEAFNRLSDYYLQNFQEHLHIHPFLAYETLNVFQYSCPVCQSSDRDRLYALYLSRKFAELDKNKKYEFVDIAPAPALAAFIRKYSFINYRSADLFMPGVDDVVDITNMTAYADNSKDIFICSHILEHIPDDRKAMRELFRILKPGGFGIAMVPIMLTLEHSYENAPAETASERWKHYGQDDHVRIYSKNDFISRLKETGFKVNQYDVNYFGESTFLNVGINKRSVLYVVEKPF